MQHKEFYHRVAREAKKEPVETATDDELMRGA